MRKLHTILLPALCAVALVSCNKPAGQATATAPAQSPAAAQPCTAEDPAPLRADAGGNEAAGDAQAARLGVCKEYCAYCGRSIGENIAPPADEPISFNVNFENVVFNSAEDANMSKLDFELVGVWRNRERMHTALSMDDRLQDSFPRVETGLCRLEVQPVLSEVVESAIRLRGPSDYKTYGAYTVTVSDPAGELVGEFPLDGLGEPGEAQWQNTKESVYHVGKSYRRDTDEWRFDIRRMSEFRTAKYEAPVL